MITNIEPPLSPLQQIAKEFNVEIQEFFDTIDYTATYQLKGAEENCLAAKQAILEMRPIGIPFYFK